jgi:nucleoside-triphosphatase THEP1
VSGARIGLLTGPVGVGKTTVAERVVSLARRQGLTCGGLLAPEMKNGCGQKAGIWGVDLLTADRRILARTDQDLGGPTIGPYSFDAVALAWAASVAEGAVGACDLLVVDEIGKLELWRGLGLASMLSLLASGEASRSLVLVRDSLLAELQARLEPVEQVVFRVRQTNRADVPHRIFERLVHGQEYQIDQEV